MKTHGFKKTNGFKTINGFNWHGIGAIYRFEMARTFRTITQSIASPVLSTSLYFVVFGAAIGSRMGQVDGVSYGAFIIPGLLMLSLLNESISNASFGIYMPKFAGTIYEMLSAPISVVEVLAGYVGAAATKSVMLGTIILVTARLFVQWIAYHDDGETSVDNTIEIKELAALKVDVVDYTSESDQEGLSVYLETIDPNGNADQNYELHVTSTTEYKFGPASN